MDGNQYAVSEARLQPAAFGRGPGKWKFTHAAASLVGDSVSGSRGSARGASSVLTRNGLREQQLALLSLTITVLLAGAFPLQAQAPAPVDIGPDQNTDVSTTISTGDGYDASSGRVRRRVIDLVVPGSVGSEPLKVERTYFSMPYGGWGIGPDTGGSIQGKPEFSSLVVSFPDGRRTAFHAPKASQTGETAWRGPLGTKERLFINRTNQYSATADLWMADGSHKLFNWRTELSANDQYLIDIFSPLYFADRYGQKTTWVREQIPGTFDPEDVRLKKVVDASGRSLTYTYDGSYVSQITASTSQWVKYTWTPFGEYANGRQLARADYSDGTFATYTYQDIPVIAFDGSSSRQTELITAQDTRAEGPMRAIQYEYTPTPQKDFPGEIKTERHFGDGVAVSTFTRNSDRTSNTDTRGDGPTRTIKMQKVDNVPLVTAKSDFYGRFEYFYYDSNSYVRQVTDRRGNSTLYANEPILGQPTKITHPDGTYVAYTYSSNLYPYHVSSVRDELGRYTYYSRDANNRIYQINYPDGASETFAYNNFGQVTTHRRKNGAYEHASYGATGLLTALWNPTASATPVATEPKTTFTYYTSSDIWQWQDRVRNVIDPRGQTTIYEYDRGSDGVQCAGRGLVTRIINPDWTFKTFGYDTFGNKIWEENELRQRMSYAYDDYNRLLSVTNPYGQATSLTYTPTNGNWSASSYTHTTNSPRTITTPTGIVTANVYDANFRKTSTISANGTPQAATTWFEYDAEGNQTKVIDPRNFGITTVYDNRDRKTSSSNPLMQVTRWGYDAVGNVLTLTQPDNTQQIKTYDAMNRVLTDKDALGRVTTFTYNGSGTRASVRDANLHTTGFTYDAADTKIQMLYQNGDHEDYAYDANHNLTSRRIASGKYQTFTYDGRNRKTAMGWHDTADPSSPDIVWANGAIDKSTFGYDAASKITSAANQFSTVTRSYDAAGRLLSDNQNLGFAAKKVQYAYNADGRPVRLYVADGNGYDRTYTYDAMGRLDKIKNTSDQAAWFGYTYDAASNETQRLNYFNSVAQVYTRDALNRMSRRDLKSGSGVSFAYEAYGFDGMSRLLSIDRQDGKRDLFGYSVAGELTSAKYGLVNNLNPQRTVSYTLDGVGNRTQVVDGGVSKVYSPDDINRYTSVGGAAIVSRPAHQVGTYQANNYQYVGGNYLASVTGPATYVLAYDALGRCAKRTLNGVVTYHVYDGEKPILEYASNGGLAGWNLYGKGIDEILMRSDYVVVPTGQGYFCQQDHEGSVTHLTGWSGEVIESYSYDAFGAPTTTYSGGSFNNRFKFTGREYAARFGIYEYRARGYHPGLGRFLSEDPKGFDAGDYNLFRYCGNDPLDKVDPMGLVAWGGFRLATYSAGVLAWDYRFVERKVVQTSSTITFRLGSLIPFRATFNQVKSGDRNIHVPRILSQGKTGERTGAPTNLIGVTDASLILHDPVQQGEHNSLLTAEMNINVYYADGAKQAAKDFGFPLEPQHAQAFDHWFDVYGKSTINGLNQRSFESPSAAKAALDGSGLRRTFDQTKFETHQQLDIPSPLNGACPHCYPGEAF